MGFKVRLASEGTFGVQRTAALVEAAHATMKPGHATSGCWRLIGLGVTSRLQPGRVTLVGTCDKLVMHA